jgi:hypothetical protein
MRYGPREQYAYIEEPKLAYIVPIHPEERARQPTLCQSHTLIPLGLSYIGRRP